MEDIVTVLVLALGLSMDAFAVSLSNGICYKDVFLKKGFFVALTFAVFQGVMTILGWLLGSAVSGYIEDFDHWIAFGLLAAIGLKMIAESARGKRENEVPQKPNLSYRQLLTQGVATSIDAMAVGVSFATLSGAIWLPSALIAGVTFVICAAGVYIGKRFGKLLGNWAQIFGGLVLLLIGIKILLEHLLT